MPIRAKAEKFLNNDWVVALFLLIIFFLTNGYIYGWDDQHLEIPMLKSLIDPALYQGDYYIESLQKNFPSFFYSILSRLITVKQIPVVYFVLYLATKYFLLLGTFKLWHHISQKRLSAFLCTLTIFLILRVEEFIYRTFSHQEFALAIIVTGIYFFYKERYVLAAAVLGIAANIHALYSLFPMIYMGVYLLSSVKKYGWRLPVKSAIAFVVGALPFLIWKIPKMLQTAPGAHVSPPLEEWMPLYLLANPQNFIFTDTPLPEVFSSLTAFLQEAHLYLWLIALFILNFIHNESFRTNRKNIITAGVVFVLLIVSFIFSYPFPNLFIIDLNLIRNTQFLLFILTGYTTLLVISATEKYTPLAGFILGLLFICFRFSTLANPAILLMILLLWYWQKKQQGEQPFKKIILAGIALGVVVITALLLSNFFSAGDRAKASILKILIPLFILFSGNFFLSYVLKQKVDTGVFKKIFVIIPFVVMFLSFGQHHLRYNKIVRSGSGFWQLQRNWEDMQRYVRDHTPKDALLLVPYDMEMGGFRIQSERKIICSYRDCGITGFDYNAGIEWTRRKADIGTFQVFAREDISPAIINAIVKYRVDYIVFMRYYAIPHKTATFEKVYENEIFALYKVKRNS